MQVVFTVLVSLAAVVGLIFLTLYLTKSLMRKFDFKPSGSGGMKLISCMGIGQDKSIVAVQAGEKYLLLGVTAADIKVLAELNDSDIAAMTCSDNAQNTRTFGEILSENMKKTFGGNKDGKQ